VRFHAASPHVLTANPNHPATATALVQRALRRNPRPDSRLSVPPAWPPRRPFSDSSRKNKLARSDTPPIPRRQARSRDRVGSIVENEGSPYAAHLPSELVQSIVLSDTASKLRDPPCDLPSTAISLRGLVACEFLRQHRVRLCSASPARPPSRSRTRRSRYAGRYRRESVAP